MKKLHAFALVAALATLLPSAATAQACLGAPVLPGESAVAGNVTFPRGGKAYGLRYTHHHKVGLVLSHHYEHTLFSGDSLADQRTLHGSLSFDVAPHALGTETALSLCPIVSAGYRESQGQYSTEVPLGLAVGGWFKVGGHYIVPSIQPEWLLTSDAELGNAPAVTGRALLASGPLFLGFSVRQEFRGKIEPVFSLTSGFIF